jgi:cytochrome c oxidase subunit II
VAALLYRKSPVVDALRAAGRDAAEVANLFWVMAAGAAVIWLVTTALSLYATRSHRAPWSERAGLILIAVGGGVVPVVVLAALFAFGLPSLARQRAGAENATTRITVIGEQWWWRVQYELPDGTRVELANEVRLPRDRVTAVTLTSTNVIHSFWVPALAGKVDMTPGRVTHLTLEPTVAGTYRGVCAEYCGASHARMGFDVEVMEPAEFDRWLNEEARPAFATGRLNSVPGTDLNPADGAGRLNSVPGTELDGARAFDRNGCAACHSVRGTAAIATIGPDLTHVGRRRRIAAASLPNQPDELVRFLARPDHIKPGILMPAFAMLPAGELRAIAAYLQSLQ